MVGRGRWAGFSGFDLRSGSLRVKVRLARQQARYSENDDVRQSIAHGSIINALFNFSGSQNEKSGEGGGKAETRMARAIRSMQGQRRERKQKAGTRALILVRVAGTFTLAALKS